MTPMRIVVTGATGNVGTSVVAALARDPQVSEIVGLARRPAALGAPRARVEAVDETWPTGGTASSFYAKDKADVERILDGIEGVRTVRLRPGLIFKREAASEIRRLFAGPLMPNPLLRRGLIGFVPDVPRLRFQAVHSDDVGEAYRLAAVKDVGGAFNIAADPVLDPAELGRILQARLVPVSARVLRAGAALSYRARLQPTEPGWLDMALAVPIMDTRRARSELGWTPRHTAADALLELLDGMRRGDGDDTPPLEPGNAGMLRWRELASGLDARRG